jgi:hypothetical protein
LASVAALAAAAMPATTDKATSADMIILMLLSSPLCGRCWCRHESNARWGAKPFAVSRTCERKLRAMRAPVSASAILHGWVLARGGASAPRGAACSGGEGHARRGSVAAHARSAATAYARQPERAAPRGGKSRMQLTQRQSPGHR